MRLPVRAGVTEINNLDTTHASASERTLKKKVLGLYVAVRDPACVVEKPQSRGDIPDQACGLAFTVRPLLTHSIEELTPGA
jgi:hypothetical protein